MKIEKPKDLGMFPAGMHRFAALKQSGMRSERRQRILAEIPHTRAVTRSMYTGSHTLVLAVDAFKHKLPTVGFSYFTA